MRNRRIQLLVTPLLLIAQVAHTIPVAAADSTTVPTTVETNQNITFDLNSPELVLAKNIQPNFTTDVLVPLRAAQAAEAQAAAQAAAAAKLAAAVKRKTNTARVVMGAVTGDVWYNLRLCESGNTYSRNSGNGYFGAYQYNIGTWANFAGYARPDLAPPAVQDEKARQTQAARGWRPWPTCALKLGLL